METISNCKHCGKKPEASEYYCDTSVRSSTKAFIKCCFAVEEKMKNVIYQGESTYSGMENRYKEAFNRCLIKWNKFNK